MRANKNAEKISIVDFRRGNSPYFHSPGYALDRKVHLIFFDLELDNQLYKNYLHQRAMMGFIYNFFFHSFTNIYCLNAFDGLFRGYFSSLHRGWFKIP